ncbi:hypothetical protein C7R54_00130 [Achromobacter aloeverae]|uniref:Uncharacterized protein n=1 Tax=Achromobacter aloeverae TaxID=1750518 RepID=A0A4Q1HPE8_9BURK|nr:hypothetical protein C7R54_00130 [Achromobacter aloeverae]
MILVVLNNERRSSCYFAKARRARASNALGCVNGITTLLAGFASTVGWPLSTHMELHGYGAA